MSNVPATTKPLAIKEALENRRYEMSQIIPKHVNLDRFIKSAIMIAHNNEKILNSTPASVMIAVQTAAELGLDFVPVKGHAYLVPFFNKKLGKYETKFMAGYRGLVDLVRRSGLIDGIETHCVYEADEFKVEYGSNSRIVHNPVYENRGKIIGAYAIAFPKSGRNIFEYMTLEELEKTRQRSRTPNEGPWVTDTSEMYRKCPIRRLFKWLPSSPDMDKAIDADNNLYELPEAPKLAKPDSVPEIPAPDTDTSDEPAPPLQQPAGTRKRRTKAQIDADKAPEQPAQAVQAQAKEEIVDLF